MNKLNGESAIFKRALAALDAAGAKYKIVLPTGESFGDLELEKPKRGRRQIHPYGQIRDFLKPYIGELEPGGFTEVPFGPYLGHELTKRVSAYGCTKWGKGKVIVSTNKDRGVVEVLRVG